MAATSRTQENEERTERRRLIWVLSLFVVVSLGGAVSPAARLMQYLFPAMAFGVSIYAYLHSKATYASLVCWLWMLTPLERRLIDYRAGWIPATAVLLGPVLACFAPMPPIVFNWRKLATRATPALFAVGAILYGLVIALLLHNQKVPMANSFLYWIAPICFGLFICTSRVEAPDILKAIERAFVQGLVVIAAYGLYQFFFMPPWDAYWMENSNLASIGFPLPLQCRVFGTMNSPQVLGAFLVIALFFSFQSQGRVRYVSIPMGLLALLLAGSRSAWIGFLIGLVYLFFHLPGRQRLQIVAFSVFGAVLLLVALQSDARDSVLNRFQSLQDPGHDYSFVSRSDGYLTLIPDTLNAPYGAGEGFDDPIVSKNGKGMGSGDSTVIAILFSLGYPGTLVYLAGLVLMGGGLLRKNASDMPGVYVLKAAAFGLAAESVLTNTLQGPGGFLVWSSLSLTYVLSMQTKRSEDEGSTFSAPSFGRRSAPAN